MSKIYNILKEIKYLDEAFIDKESYEEMFFFYHAKNHKKGTMITKDILSSLNSNTKMTSLAGYAIMCFGESIMAEILWNTIVCFYNRISIPVDENEYERVKLEDVINGLQIEEEMKRFLADFSL